MLEMLNQKLTWVNLAVSELNDEHFDSEAIGNIKQHVKNVKVQNTRNP